MWFTQPLDELGAAISTSNATWWMVPATVLSGIGAFAAAVAALKIAGDEGRRETSRRRAWNIAVRTALTRIEATLRAAPEVAQAPINHHDVWTRIGELQGLRQVLQRYLSSSVTDAELVYEVAAIQQRIYEVRHALSSLLVNGGQYADVQLSPADVQKQLTSVLSRLDTP